MKHILTIFLLLATLTVAAQNYSPCYTNNIAEGNVAYNQGRYTEAKTYYQNALKCPNGNAEEAKMRINMCDIKLNLALQQQPSSSIPKINQTFTVNGISFKMTYVQGGIFTMGCTSEQGGDCEDGEKPAHMVTLQELSYRRNGGDVGLVSIIYQRDGLSHRCGERRLGMAVDVC